MILIFDYFETLLNNTAIDFNRGLKDFWEKHYKDKCSFEEIKAYGEELFEHILSLHAEGKEFAFVRDELPLYAERYGGDTILMSVEEEADFLIRCNDFFIEPGLKDMLESFMQKDIPMYVLSNSGFTAGALMNILNRYDIGQYFRHLWSSADFGRIKPCRDFFELAISTALEENPDEKREDIIFVGDIYETDVIGASDAGIKSVWINKKNEEDERGLATYIISSIEDLSKIV